MKAVCNAMGIKVTFKAGPWNEIRKALENGKVEALPLVSYSAERAKIFAFTTPHTISYAAIFKRKSSPNINSLDDLKNKSIVTMQSDATHDWLLKTSTTGKIILTKTIHDAVLNLSNAKSEYALLPRLVGLLEIQKLNLKHIEITGPNIPVYGRGYGFAVIKGDDALLNQLNQGLAIIKETGRYDETYDKWFGIVDPRGMAQKIIYKYALWGVGAILSIILVFMIWTISLRHTVERRTKSLQNVIQDREKAKHELSVHYEN